MTLRCEKQEKLKLCTKPLIEGHPEEEEEDES